MLLTKIALIAGGGKLIHLISKGLKTKNAAESLNIKPVAVGWRGFNGFSLKFSLKLKAFNPTDTDLTLNFVHADIFVKTLKIANVQKLHYNKILKAEQETSFKVDVGISGLSLFRLLSTTIGDLIKLGKYPNSLIIKGYVKANNFTVPFDESVRVRKE